jgi:hypothetical protein
MWLRKLYAASVAAVCHFTLNLKTEVWRIPGIDASSGREVTGSGCSAAITTGWRLGVRHRRGLPLSRLGCFWAAILLQIACMIGRLSGNRGRIFFLAW